MNTMLLELLAAQAGATGNPAVAEAMARMQGVSAANSDVNPSDLIAQVSNGNPLLAMFLKNMAEKNEKKSSAEESEVIDLEPVEVRSNQMEEPREESANYADSTSAESHQQAETLLAELALLRERNDLFAAAVGACCLCWGQDLGCRSCRGRGGPGFSVPDETLFQEYVAPAIHTLRAQKAKFRSS
jgi:hypothetical protein